MTDKAISPLRQRMIEDMDPGILDSHCRHRRIIATNPGSLRKHSYIVMLLTSSSKQFRLRQLGGFSGPQGSICLMRFEYHRGVHA